MITDAFEDAFYQLDLDRDGVVTIQDLQRYSEEKNLKDKFVKKWLNLFADEKNIIYYDKFCTTLGIVPGSEKFEQKIYKIDMTNPTQKSITDIISNIYERNNELSDDSLEEIRYQIQNSHDGQWDIKINPTKEDINVKYSNDGILYYSPTSKENLKILVWKVPENDEFQTKINKIDMTEDTRKSVTNIVAESQQIDKSLSPKTLGEIKTRISAENGGDWNVVMNPNSNDLTAKYGEDGLLYYNPNIDENNNLLIYRVTNDENDSNNAVIYDCDMSENIKHEILKLVYDKTKNNVIESDAIILELDEKFGQSWNFQSNPTEKQLKVNYDLDGKIYFSTNSDEEPKLFIWREDKLKKRGSLCCCGCF